MAHGLGCPIKPEEPVALAVNVTPQALALGPADEGWAYALLDEQYHAFDETSDPFAVGPGGVTGHYSSGAAPSERIPQLERIDGAQQRFDGGWLYYFKHPRTGQPIVVGTWNGNWRAYSDEP